MAFGSVNAAGGASGRTMEEISDKIQAVQDETEAALQEHAAAENPHGITPAEIGAVPEERKVNGKPLTGDITLGSADVGAVPTSRKINGKALTSDITLNFSDLGGAVFQAGTTAPANKGLLWIDTTANTGGLKYHNGTAWVHVPVSTT